MAGVNLEYDRGVLFDEVEVLLVLKKPGVESGDVLLIEDGLEDGDDGLLFGLTHEKVVGRVGGTVG